MLWLAMLWELRYVVGFVIVVVACAVWFDSRFDN